MRIKFNPQRRDDELLLHVEGEIVTVNYISYDLSVIPDGATLPRDAIYGEFLSGDINRVDGELEIVITLPHKADAPTAITFPQDIVITEDGVVVDTANNIYPWSVE